MLAQATTVCLFIAWGVTQGYAVGIGFGFELIALFVLGTFILSPRGRKTK
jgi:hypothetical protein